MVGVSAVFVLGSSRLHLPGCGPAVAALGGGEQSRSVETYGISCGFRYADTAKTPCVDFECFVVAVF